MVRKLMFITSLLVLATVFTGVSFANVLPTQIAFFPDPSTAAFTVGTNSAVVPTTVGGAIQCQACTAGNFSLGGATVFISAGHSPLLMPNSESFDVQIGTDLLQGGLSLLAMIPLNPGGLNFGTFLGGRYFVTSATSGFANAGYRVGSVLPIDFVLNPDGSLSSGQLRPVPEPGTIALVGSGLLAAAGLLRRKL